MNDATKEKAESIGVVLRFVWPLVMGVLGVLLLREMAAIDKSFDILTTQVRMVHIEVTTARAERLNFKEDLDDLDERVDMHDNRIRALEIDHAERISSSRNK